MTRLVWDPKSNIEAHSNQPKQVLEQGRRVLQHFWRIGTSSAAGFRRFWCRISMDFRRFRTFTVRVRWTSPG